MLRSAYKLTRESVLKSILTICGLPQVVVENSDQVAKAIDYYKEGMDFADALHYVANLEIECFYTFDEKCIKCGGRLNLEISKLP